jgi:hypothetical protein
MDDHLTELIRLSEEMGLYDIPREVCVTHKRFVPCRHYNDECLLSSRPDDIKAVEIYQALLAQGIEQLASNQQAEGSIPSRRTQP